MPSGWEYKYDVGQKVLVRNQQGRTSGTITARRPGGVEPGYTVELDDGRVVEAKEDDLQRP
jgi:hypothetical protein